MTNQKLLSILLGQQGEGSLKYFRKPQQPDPAHIDNSDAFKFLSSLRTFSQLSEQELEMLADASRFTNVTPGEYVSLEGDDFNPNGFIVISGRMALTKTSINGKDLVVELMAPGDIFGLLLLLPLEELKNQLSARAQIKSKLLWLPVKLLVSILDRHPTLYRDFIAHLIHCLQSSYRIARGLAHDRVEVRIASILLNLGLKFARSNPSAKDNTIDITRQQLADLTGTTPETAIRITRTMQSDGLIDIKKPGVILLLDCEALQVIAEEE